VVHDGAEQTPTNDACPTAHPRPASYLHLREVTMLAQRSAACAAVLLLACANALVASDTTFVSQGARVKVFPSMEGTEPVVGEVVQFSYDTLVIVPEGNGSAQTFYPGDLRKIEVSQGKKSNVGKGAWIGAAAGAVFGLIIGAASGPYECCTTGTIAAGMAGISAAGGALIGVGVGAATSSERWVEAELPARPPVALNVGKDGSVRLAFSLRL
jgi:hypothetical protein